MYKSMLYVCVYVCIKVYIYVYICIYIYTYQGACSNNWHTNTENYGTNITRKTNVEYKIA